MFKKVITDKLDWKNRQDTQSTGVIGIVDQDFKVVYFFLGFPFYTKIVTTTNVGNYNMGENKQVGFSSYKQ